MTPPKASQSKIRSAAKLQAKRNVELWIYSFADMYMILSVFFIALSVIYAAKIKEQHLTQNAAPSAGRGPASVISELELEFENGSVDLSPKALEDMSLMIPALKQVKNGFIEIEGYADGRPLRHDSQFSSNLDLSTRRAVRVAEWFIKNGISARKVRTFSYGDAHLYSVKDSPASNRRVVIKLAAYGAKQ